MRLSTGKFQTLPIGYIELKRKRAQVSAPVETSADLSYRHH